MRTFVGFLAGLTFGLGLVVSGMSNPLKVQNFLDVFGTFDPSLMFVMGGAVLVGLPFFRFVQRMPRPLIADDFRIPGAQYIDSRLITGSAIFGLGWGLIGLCPGPALVSLALLTPQALLFVFFMLLGMLSAKILASYSLCRLLKAA